MAMMISSSTIDFSQRDIIQGKVHISKVVDRSLVVILLFITLIE